MVNVTYDSSGDLEQSDGSGSVFNMGVWIMIPGVGFFYSDLLRRKNTLNMIYLSMMTVAWIPFDRYSLGYFALRNVLDQPSAGSPKVPAIVFCIFQLMFAAITPMIAIGAIAGCSRLGPLLAFVFAWSTLVYDPITCWTWNPKGWSYVLGGLDFAGGIPIHISSGTAALAISLYLGKRQGFGLAYKPHNTTYVILGIVFLWFGWFSFNGGSALSANLRATQACIVTNLAASVSGLTWMFWDYRLERKWSVVGFCSGAISGLVAITPGSGFVGSRDCMAGTVCNFATQLKFIFGYDDTLDIFASHAIGGIVGNSSVAGADDITTIPGGWLDHNYRQLSIQLADSAIILWIMHYIPGLRLRCDEETEILGVDDAEMGEFAYDYVGIENELMPSGEYSVGASAGNREPRHTAATTSQISEQEKDPKQLSAEA
ncbi:ammonium transporter AmtB-like domain-containing protein [Suillus lakei]|nr:ammonium transporter AmtB-like domain-containing protein [Suillus lakei]